MANLLRTPVANSFSRLQSRSLPSRCVCVLLLCGIGRCRSVKILKTKRSQQYYPWTYVIYSQMAQSKSVLLNSSASLTHRAQVRPAWLICKFDPQSTSPSCLIHLQDWPTDQVCPAWLICKLDPHVQGEPSEATSFTRTGLDWIKFCKKYPE